MNESLHIVCPHCDTINRLTRAHLGSAANCGKCRQALFTAHPVELDATRFDRHLQRNDIPILVDFWAPWCGPCKMMTPQFASAAAQLEPHFRLAKVNTEAEQLLGTRFNIRSIPTMIVFHRGKEVGRVSGALGAAEIVRWARSQA